MSGEFAFVVEGAVCGYWIEPGPGGRCGFRIRGCAEVFLADARLAGRLWPSGSVVASCRRPSAGTVEVIDLECGPPGPRIARRSSDAIDLVAVASRPGR